MSLRKSWPIAGLEMNGASLDTNIILRLAIDDVPEQTAAATKFVERHKCYVTDVVVTETVYALERLYKLERSEVTVVLRYILRSFRITYNSRLLDEVFDVYETRRSLSFVDCYAKIEAGQNGYDLVTFDKKLIRSSPHIKDPG